MDDLDRAGLDVVNPVLDDLMRLGGERVGAGMANDSEADTRDPIARRLEVDDDVPRGVAALERRAAEAFRFVEERIDGRARSALEASSS